MRLRAEHQLFLTYLALIGVLTLAMSLGAASLLRRELTGTVEADLRRELALGRVVLERSAGVAPDSVARLIASVSGRRATIVGPAGELVGESHPEQLESPDLTDYRLRPEIQAAFAGGEGRVVRADPAGEGEYLLLAALTDRGEVLRLGRSLREIDASLTRLRRGVFGAGLLAVLLAAGFSFSFSLSVTGPLRRIGEVARALAAGDLSRRVRLRREDELGELGGALNALADELQRRLGQLEGERAEMQALIDAMSEGVLALSPAGTLRRANPAAQRMFSLGPEPRGLPPERVSRRPDFLKLVGRALQGETILPNELIGPGGPLLATGHPLPDGGAVLVFLDISELRRLEGVRRDFVANASHELKTPLTAIRGYSETLAEPDLPPDLVRRFAGIVNANADRLQRIVDDLLDLSRIEARGWRVNPTLVAVEEVSRDTWAAQKGEGKELELRVELAPGHERVWADAGAVRQILSNLLGNALRYTPEGGTITVRTRRGAARPGAQPHAEGLATPVQSWTTIEVEDTGSGIASAHLSRIFERFYRADPARSREEGGTGLGLSIVKHLVESHGGWIEAESEVGRGTVVRFVLPAAAEAGPPA